MGKQNADKPQIFSLRIGNFTIDFFKVNKTDNGVYLVPVPDIAINAQGKGSGLHFSFHPNSNALFFKSYDPLITLKTVDLKELEKNIPSIFEKIICPPCANEEVIITINKPGGLSSNIEGNRTVFNLINLKESMIDTVILPNTDNLKEELCRLELDDKTKGHFKMMRWGNSGFGMFIPLTPEQIVAMNKKYLSQKTIDVILEYGGIIVSFDEETIKSIFKWMGISSESLEKLIKESVAGSKHITDQFGKAIADSFIALPEGQLVENTVSDEHKFEDSVKVSEGSAGAESQL